MPLWYPEEIENAIRSLFAAVFETYYNSRLFDQKPLFHRVRVDEKSKKNKNQKHDLIRCQACHDGICVTSGIFFKLKIVLNPLYLY